MFVVSFCRGPKYCGDLGGTMKGKGYRSAAFSLLEHDQLEVLVGTAIAEGDDVLS